MRKLASIQKIRALEPIEGADAIETTKRYSSAEQRTELSAPCPFPFGSMATGIVVGIRICVDFERNMVFVVNFEKQ